MAQARASLEAVAGRYAGAIFELAVKANVAEAVVQAFTALATAISNNTDIVRALANPLTSREQKADLLAAAVNKAPALVQQAVHIIATQGRSEAVPAIAEALQQRLRESRGEMRVRVTSAVPLATATKQQLEGALQKATGKTPLIDAITDNAVIGGVKLHIGGTLLDATLATGLENMRKRLLAANA